MYRCVVADMVSRADPIIPELKENGVNTVFRYYAPCYQPGLPEKRLSLAERNALFESGIALGVVFQLDNDRLSSMTPAKGRDDARFSLDFGQAVIRQPSGSAIYFEVGGDWSDSDDLAAVGDYFGAIKTEFEAAGSPYRIGVYGSGTICDFLRRQELAELFWLPLSKNWSGTREFFNSGAWTFCRNHHGLKVGGRYTDTNVINPTSPGIGSFDGEGVVMDVGQDRSVFETRAFVDQETVDLVNAPCTGAEVVGRLKQGQNVHILETIDNWAYVDVNEDGRPEGYCSSGHLMGFDRMP